ncbi:hypothetical protein JOF56_008882 [Kibdelosporangium banguiense]|uniref:Uncharacterized protein n=1 Tax=Kibdelosporangium banguiense TaxID=1365924 RepID=A0ABS4TVR6_9PSEU|nr:hypothetical protein [Kibdelosporangium banguiense]MBP2328497.1 hypothetical protein [Kibdelosporangium banguiense]
MTSVNVVLYWSADQSSPGPVRVSDVRAATGLRRTRPVTPRDRTDGTLFPRHLIMRNGGWKWVL